MSTIIADCLNCQEQFNAPLREVNRGNGKFCSISCAAQYNNNNRPKPEPNVECAYCREKFYKAPNKQKLSKSGLYFCCREHKDLAQRIGGVEAIQPEHYGLGIRNYRTIAFREKPKVCERCGYDDHEAAIIIHHKDRNRNNSALENLEVLCCNCHAIEHYGE